MQQASLYDRAAILFQGGEVQEATSLIEAGLAATPDDAALHYGLGCVHQATERWQAAREAYGRAVTLQPGYVDAWYGLGSAHHRLGDEARALECFEKAVELCPEHTSATHLAAALRRESPTAPPQGFVRELFESYAPRYDEHLCDTLRYRAPDEMVRVLDPLLAERKDLEVVDLGCGTGLVGERLRSRASHLVGVDLSPAMLRRASDRGCYDELVEGDLESFLGRSPADRFDLVTAVEVIGYVGALDGLFERAPRVLRSGGLLALTFEELSGGGHEFRLTPGGRYAHSKEYVRRLADGALLAVVALEPIALRVERDHLCRGLAIVMTSE